MSIHEVATRLHLKPAVILALEEDRYHDLPGATFGRGYLRAYARLMRLDVEGSLQSEQLKDDGAMIHPLTGLSSPKIGGSGWMFKIAGYLIVAALGLWMVSWWQGRRNDEMDKAISLESLITDDSPAPESDRVQPGTKKVAAVEKRKVSGGSNAQIGDKISAVEVLGRHRRSPLEEIPPRRRIEIMPVQEAWIEITDAAQRSLFYGLAKPGQAVSLSGAQPFKLVLGNASEVDVRYDGKRVEMNRFIYKGVAHFTLDDKGPHP